MIEKEEKQLLTKVLLAMSPYRLIVKTEEEIEEPFVARLLGVDVYKERATFGLYKGNDLIVMSDADISEVKPYLRPLTSMSDKEKDELRDIIYFGYPSDDYDNYGHRGVEVAIVEHDEWGKLEFDFDDFIRLERWLCEHKFDYMGLIPKGLAEEAKEGMYNIKE